MKTDRIFPETLQQLILDVLQKTPDFKYIKGIQPFFMTYKNKPYYVYVKNLSSAYFRERPDTTRAQLPIKDEFEEIKKSPYPFIFFGYDQNNDVLVCWNYHIVKQRLNMAKSVSFYSRTFFQEEVAEGELLQKRLKNGDEPVLFHRKNLRLFFDRVDSLFNESITNCASSPEEGKIRIITDEKLITLLRPLLNTETPHTLEAIKVAEQYYQGKYPKMKLKDWATLVKQIKY
jgi:hypothetical protein